MGTILAYGLTATLVGQPRYHPEIGRNSVPDLPLTNQQNSVLVMTQNMAHGRADGVNQILQSGSTIEANLRDIVAVFQRVDPDIVALQEADAPSVWSGNFNHVQFLAEAAPFPYYVHGEHVASTRLSYGTAVLSKLPVSTTLAITFAPTPPTPAKGFVVATVTWPDESGKVIDIVSVHLDFLRSDVRDAQVAEIIDVLSQSANPVIVMGDFNSDWQVEDSPIRKLVEALDLKVYEPESQAYVTFATLDTRYDWIMISQELEFKTYEVLTEQISDHAAIVSEIVFVEDATAVYDP